MCDMSFWDFFLKFDNHLSLVLTIVSIPIIIINSTDFFFKNYIYKLKNLKTNLDVVNDASYNHAKNNVKFFVL